MVNITYHEEHTGYYTVSMYWGLKQKEKSENLVCVWGKG